MYFPMGAPTCSWTININCSTKNTFSPSFSQSNFTNDPKKLCYNCGRVRGYRFKITCNHPKSNFDNYDQVVTLGPFHIAKFCHACQFSARPLNTPSPRFTETDNNATPYHPSTSPKMLTSISLGCSFRIDVMFRHFRDI